MNGLDIGRVVTYEKFYVGSNRARADEFDHRLGESEVNF
jgi:hypothetical protein